VVQLGGENPGRKDKWGRGVGGNERSPIHDVMVTVDQPQERQEPLDRAGRASKGNAWGRKKGQVRKTTKK